MNSAPKSRPLRASKRPLLVLAASALAAGAVLGVAPPARAAASGTLPMALTSYLDTTANVIHVFYLGDDGGVYALTAPVAKAGSATGWSCSPVLPAMSLNSATHTSSVVAGGMIPGGNLASTYDGTNGHLYYIGSDGGLWGATGNPPTAATGQSLNQIVGGGVPKPTSQATSYCIPSTKYSYGECFQGLSNPATIAAAAQAGTQNVFYQGTDGVLHDLTFGGPVTSWLATTVGSNGANALNGKGLSAASSFGAHVFFDDAVGDAEVWDQFFLIKSTGGVGGVAWQAADTLDVDFQGFLASSQVTTGGIVGLGLAGPDPSQSVPAIDTATNADASGAWTVSTLRQAVVPAGPILIVDAGYKTAAPDGLNGWLFYVGAYGNIRMGSNIQLTGLTGNSGVTPATSSANTVYTPLTGVYTTPDTTVHVYYVGSDNNVYELNLPQVSGGVMTHPNILPANCPPAMQ